MNGSAAPPGSVVAPRRRAHLTDDSQTPDSRRTVSVPGLVRELWPYLRPSRRRLALAAVVSLLLTAIEVATPLLIGLLIDSILARLHGRIPGVTPVLSQGWIFTLLGGAAVLRGLLLTRQRWLAGWIGERVAARMRDALFDHLQRLPLDYARARGPGALLLRFNSDARAVQRLVTSGLIQLSQALLLGAGVFVVMALINLRMVLAVAVVVPAFALLFRWLNPRLRHESRAVRRRRSRLSTYLHERLAGLAVVKAFVRQDAEADHVKELNKDIARRATRRALVAGQLQGWAAAAVALGGVLVLFLATREAVAGRLTAGSLVAFYTLLGLLLPVFQRVATANNYLQEGRISVERFTHTLRLPPEIPARDKSPDLRVTSGDIRVQDVSVRLGDGPLLLAPLSLEARRGSVTAVIGPNGAGKTTLIELLLRFRAPSAGRILIDGQDTARVSLRSLRTQIGFVAQDTALFDGTLRENVAYGLPKGVPEDRVERVARLTGVDQIVQRLPAGWDTRVGRGGRHLSAGQRRQVALARALAVDPPILLLDEPATALDAETEAALARLLKTLAREKTILIVAPRLSSAFQPAVTIPLAPLPIGQERRPPNPDGVAGEDGEAEDDDAD